MKFVCSIRAMKLKLWFKQYCLSTYLPGYKYFFLSKRILLERVIWIIIVSSSSLAALVLLFVRKQTIKEDTILVTDSISHPIWNYQFPAVTICSFNKISRTRALDQAEQLSVKLNHTNEEIADLFSLLGHLYFNDVNSTDNENRKYLRLVRLLDYNEPNLNILLRNVSPSCNTILRKCKWKGEEKICDMIFEKILTPEGHCCAFNYFAPEYYKFGGLRYPRRAPKKPRRVSACGYQTSLEVVVRNEPDDYFSTTNAAYGNKIIIHNSHDYPHWGQQAHLVGKEMMALIGVNPTLTQAVSGIRFLDIHDRLCYFRNEFNLRNFKIYTYFNCLTECRMNISFKYCGCIPLVYVNEYDQNIPDFRICSVRDMPCLNKYREHIVSSFPRSKKISNKIWKVDQFPCNCLPDCEFTAYDSQASQAGLTHSYSSLSSERVLLDGINEVNHSLVRIYFNDLVGIKNTRHLLRNFQTDLAHYGSILGFFVGFSLVSGIEFIYFVTVKVLMVSWKRHSPKSVPMKQDSKFNCTCVNSIEFQPEPNKAIRKKKVSQQAFSQIWFSK